MTPGRSVVGIPFGRRLKPAIVFSITSFDLSEIIRSASSFVIVSPASALATAASRTSSGTVGPASRYSASRVIPLKYDSPVVFPHVSAAAM
ncbi:MAG: hypothetical protein ACHQC9_06390 [Alphaproteobacteria bacterium]